MSSVRTIIKCRCGRVIRECQCSELCSDSIITYTELCDECKRKLTMPEYDRNFYIRKFSPLELENHEQTNGNLFNRVVESIKTTNDLMLQLIKDIEALSISINKGMGSNNIKEYKIT